MAQEPPSVANNFYLNKLDSNTNNIAYSYNFIDIKSVEPSLGVPSISTYANPTSAYYFPIITNASTYGNSRKISNSNDTLVYFNNNIGIGTSRPNNRLTVAGTISANNNILIGSSNTSSGLYASVIAGQNNKISLSGINSSIGGGTYNAISGCNSFIGGGTHNKVLSAYGYIGGGFYNQVNNTSGLIFGGTSNIVNGNASNINGGGHNLINGASSNINGGAYNIINNDFSVINGGSFNTASGNYNGIFGGKNNTLSAINSYIIGSNITVENINDTTFVENLAVLSSINIKGDLTVYGTISALSGISVKTTTFSETSALIIYNTGIGPALDVTQAFGDYDIAIFKGNQNTQVLHIGNTPVDPMDGITGHIGVNTSTPNVELTVNGSISSNGNIYASSIYADNLSNLLQQTFFPYTSGTLVNSIKPVLGANTASGYASTVAGGSNNTASASYSNVAGGQCNTVSGIYNNNSIVGGSCNRINNSENTIVGGSRNIACNNTGGVIFGHTNTVSALGFGGIAAVSNVIAGGDNNCMDRQSISVIAGGRQNCIMGGGFGNLIGGGCQNALSGIAMSTIISGFGNCISAYNGNFITVNGRCNQAIQSPLTPNFYFSSIFSGECNSNSGYNSTILGGINNTISAPVSSAIILGGRCNTASGNYSFVGSGQCNRATGPYSTIVAGFSSLASGYASIVAGGSNNIAFDNYSNIAGGNGNTAFGFFATIGGGFRNTACGSFTTVAGGSNNIAFDNYSNIAGGQCNIALNAYSFIGGGCRNIASGNSSTVAGGRLNTASGACSFVAGGSCNIASGNSSTVAGGRLNTASGAYSFIGDGSCNIASGNSSTVAGGRLNTASGACSFVAGGSCNSTRGFANTFILGSSLSATQANYTYVNNLSSQGIVSTPNGNSDQWNATYAILNSLSGTEYLTLSSSPYTYHPITSSISPIFMSNLATGLYSNIGGGRSNIASGNSSFVGNGFTNNASDISSTIVNGNFNIASNVFATVLNGSTNNATNINSTILNGYCNTASAVYSTIAGGVCNTASGNYSFIAGGQNNNTNSLANTFILGSNITAPQANYTYVNNLSSQGKLIGEGSSITNAVVTGRTIYVDANAGTDTRTGLSQYSTGSPFATIGAAVAASATGDTVRVRAGTYTIAAQIDLNSKGYLYFETGATVTVSTGVVAFSFSQSNAVKYIKGNADFILIGTAGVLTMPSGNSLTGITFECNSIYSLTTVSGTLFSCAVGVLFVDAKAIQLTPSSTSATVFNITGTGKVTTRVPFVYCGRFLNGAGVFGAQINTDIWTLIAYNSTAGIAISSITTNFRMVNYLHSGVGVAFNWAEDTTGEGHGFRGITWSSTNSQPNITFNSSAGSTTSKLIRLDQTNKMRNASTNSLSAALPINIATYGTFASVPATPNITFKIGSFTVDSDVNNF
jgi:hypothetical protein